MMDYIFSIIMPAEYLPRYECLAGDSKLIWLLNTSQVILIAQYWLIALAVFKIAFWGKHNGHWRGLFSSLACVFVWCGFNSLIYVVVTYYPLYWLQALINGIAVFASLRCIYHVTMLHKKSIGEFIKAIKMTVQSSGL